MTLSVASLILEHMFAPVMDDADAALAQIEDAIETLRRIPTSDAMAAALRASDRLTAVGLQIMGQGGFVNGSGMPMEMALRLQARMTHADARTMRRVLSMFGAMPETARAFYEGRLSFGEVRGIEWELRSWNPRDRALVDGTIGARAGTHADPEELLSSIADEMAASRDDLVADREERAIERSFLAIQPRLDGSGARFHGEGDAISIATIVGALDAHAAAPQDQGLHGISREQQHFDALLAICNASLGGGDPADGEDGARKPKRAKPCFEAVLDVTGMDEPSMHAGSRVLWHVAGRRARLSRIGTEVALCDAKVRPVIFENGQPISVGTPGERIPHKVRKAVAARDQGCRFPGCNAPVWWCDAHHVVHGGSARPSNLAMFCRRCHNRIHRRGWKVEVFPGGDLEFSYRGQTYRTSPRAGPRPN